MRNGGTCWRLGEIGVGTLWLADGESESRRSQSVASHHAALLDFNAAAMAEVCSNAARR